MNILQVNQLSKSYGANPLFSELQLAIETGDRLGIVGPNGCGKSTLLRILAGKVTADAGQMTCSKGLRVVYLDQNHGFAADLSIIDAACGLAREMGNHSEDLVPQCNALLTKAGFLDPQAKVATLSGGWNKRLGIIGALAAQGDLLLLDEPTNHLDWEGIEWLEGHLKNANFAWAMVSHDRYLLKTQAKRIIEINPVFARGFFLHQGAYESFLRGKQEFLEAQLTKQKTLDNKLRREEEWLSRGPKARSTKQKFRIDQAYKLMEERAQIGKNLNSQVQPDFRFAQSDKKSKELCEVKGLQFGFKEKSILRDLDFTLLSGQIVGILGTNGTGKSSFLKLLAGNFKPQAGRIRVPEGVEFLYFDQEKETLPADASLKDVLAPTGGDSVVMSGRSIHVITWAKKFGFNADQLTTPTSQLSGGEKARALMAHLILTHADVLLLDEPTNDLDIPTLEVLEQSLLEFNGAVIIVSHDRYLLEKVCTTYLGFVGDRLIQCADIKQWKALGQTTGLDKEKKPKEVASSKKASKLSFKEQREYDGMEENIFSLEAELEELTATAQLPEYATNPAKSEEIYGRIQHAQTTLDGLYDRWHELEEKVARFIPK